MSPRRLAERWNAALRVTATGGGPADLLQPAAANAAAASSTVLPTVLPTSDNDSALFRLLPPAAELRSVDMNASEAWACMEVTDRPNWRVVSLAAGRCFSSEVEERASISCCSCNYLKITFRSW